MSRDLRLVPVTRDEAQAFIARHHRHHGRPPGYRFAVGVARTSGDPALVGVATAGRPVARALDDGVSIEVTRCCTDGHPNACSMLYGACWRAARALGYSRALTYTDASESGASLRAAGWRLDAELDPRGGWNMPGRRRADAAHPIHVVRRRWVAGDADPVALLSGRCLLAPESSDEPAALFDLPAVTP